MKRIFSYILLTANFFGILALLFSYSSVFIAPDKLWLPSAFGLAYPYIIGLNIIFIVVWLFFKPKYIAFSLLCILIGFKYSNRYFQVFSRSIDDKAIKVLSYNVRNFKGAEKDPSKVIADKIKRFLEDEKSDIICIQEIKLRSARVFNLPKVVDQLPFINHYQYASTGSTTGLATLTKFPVLNMKEIRFEGSQNMAIYTDVLIGQDTVRIFNIHLQSYHIDPNQYDIIESPGISEKGDVRQVKEMARKFKIAVQKRAVQARLIHDIIKESPYRVIVCGDLNDSPISYAYQKVRGKLKDAFVESGSGIGRTYIGKLPSFRIDYIFHSRDYKSYSFHKAPLYESDHLPIICKLKEKD